MAINIMQRLNEDGDPVKGIKVPGTGLVLYSGGVEKTPTGMSNAFSASGLTPEDLLAYAKKYNLPTTSNREFQQAQYDLLNSTPEGRSALKEMQIKYGLPKAGKYVDDILGARTISMMMATPKQTTSSKSQMMPTEEIVTLARKPLEIKEKVSMIAPKDIDSWQDPRLSPGQRKDLYEKTVNSLILDEKNKKRIEDEREYFMRYGKYPEQKTIMDDWYAPGGMLGWNEEGEAPKWYNFRKKAMAKKNIEQFRRNINRGKNWYDAQDL
jgi:hypothetical protein